MKAWVLAIAAAALAASLLAGCVNVPPGPYVNINSEKSAGGTTGGGDLDRLLDVLEQARHDGIITRNQFNELKKRLERSCGD